MARFAVQSAFVHGRQYLNRLHLSTSTKRVLLGVRRSRKDGSKSALTEATKKAETCVSAFFEELAATYSRGIYKTTTIGKAAFDGRVRDGIGSGHSFMTTKIRL